MAGKTVLSRVDIATGLPGASACAHPHRSCLAQEPCRRSAEPSFARCPDPAFSFFFRHRLEPPGPHRLSLMATLPAYAELHCRSNFSFLTGASSPEELVDRAATL